MTHQQTYGQTSIEIEMPPVVGEPGQTTASANGAQQSPAGAGPSLAGARSAAAVQGAVAANKTHRS